MHDLSQKLVETTGAVFGRLGLRLYWKAWLWFSLALLMSGCAHWSKDQVAVDKPQQLLSPPKLSPDTVVLEAVLIRFPEEQAAELTDVWRVVDESVIDIATRRELHANGVKCGMLVGEMPQVIRSRLKELAANEPGNSLERLGLAAEVSSDTQRLHCHAGHRKELGVRPGLTETLTVVHTRDGVIHGNTYTHPYVFLDVRATPLGDGRAELKLTPEIEHGERREIFRSNQVAHFADVLPERQRWDYLSMEMKIAPGQFFLCTLSDPPRGLGQAFFSTRTSERTTERVLLVVRLMSTQLDELFAPEEVEAARLAAQH
jgi:hypothetical protein